MQPERPKPLRLFVLLVAGVTWCWLQESPPSRGGQHVERLVGGPLAVAAEGGVADVDVAEERARRGVVGPHLLLVGEQGRGLVARDHGVAPRSVGAAGRGRHVVGVRDRDRLGALERGRPGDRGGQVGVVQARPVGVREAAAGRRARPERDGRIAVGDQVVLGVVGQGPDRPGRRRAARVRADRAEAAARGEAGVGRLAPVAAGVGGEVDPGDADAAGERAVVVGPRVAGLHVDVVVGARDDDGGVARVDGHRGLVLLVLRERTRRATDAHAGVLRSRRARERDGEQGGGERAERRPERPVIDHGNPFR